MLLMVLVSLITVSATVLVHAAGTVRWIERLRRRAARADEAAKPPSVFSVLVQTALVLIALHVLEVFLWAVTYRLVPESGLASLEEAMYFSFTTFTTLGYGDITLQGPWRMLTGIESLNGVLLLGWSTAVSFAVIQRTFGKSHSAPAD